MKKFRILMGAVALAVVAATVIGCKKEESSRGLMVSQIDYDTAQSRTDGHWVEKIVVGERFDNWEGIHCIGKTGTCLKYKEWVEKAKHQQEDGYENVEYVLLPSTSSDGQEIYPTDVWLHVSDFDYNIRSGHVSFKVIK